MSVPVKDETLTTEPEPSYVVTAAEGAELVCDIKVVALALIELMNDPSLLEVPGFPTSLLTLTLDLVIV